MCTYYILIQKSLALDFSMIRCFKKNEFKLQQFDGSEIYKRLNVKAKAVGGLIG